VNHERSVVLVAFVIPMELVRLIAYSKVCISKNVSDAFPIQNGPKQGDIYCHWFSTLL